jgi:hypothetical protein
VAGSTYWYNITFTDDLGNFAVVTRQYVAWRTPFYVSADQNSSLVHVS